MSEQEQQAPEDIQYCTSDPEKVNMRLLAELSSLRAQLMEARETLKSGYEDITQLKLDHAKQFDDYRVGLLEAIDVEAEAHALRAAEVQSLRAEVERLRAALQNIGNHLGRPTTGYTAPSYQMGEMRQIIYDCAALVKVTLG